MAVSKVILNGETLIDVTQKTVTSENMLSGVTALKNDGTDITGSIAAKTAADLITSGSQVTVPSGMYAAAATTAVAAGVVKPSYGLGFYPNFNITNDGIVQVTQSVGTNQSVVTVAGYVTTTDKMYIYSTGSSSYQLPIHGDLTASGSVVTVPSGWYGAAVSKAVASGALNEIISVPSILPTWSINNSTGIINAYYATAPGIQPIASSGYFKTDEYIYPAITMDSSYQLPVKAAATIVPSTADQVVASGYFLTGAQTIKGDSALIPSNIAAGVSIFGVQGTHSGTVESLTVIPAPTDQIFNGYDQFYSISEGTKYDETQSTVQIGFTLPNYPLPNPGETYYVSGEIMYTKNGTHTIQIEGEWLCELFPSGSMQYTSYLPYTPDSTSDPYAPSAIRLYITSNSNVLFYVIFKSPSYTPTTLNVTKAIIFKQKVIDGYLPVTVNAAALQSKVVTPSTQQQIIKPDSSLYGIIPQGTVSENIYSTWQTIPGVAPPSPISVGTHIEGLIDIVYNTDKLGTIEINGDIAESHFESICTLTAIPAYQSTLQLLGTLWDSDGLNFILSITDIPLVAATDIRFDSLPVYNYYGLSQVTVEAVAATTSYYLAQDSQGYITYSSIMPSGGEYYIFDVAGIKHIEGN